MLGKYTDLIKKKS